MTLAVRCCGLRKRYQQRHNPPVDALRGIDLEIATGECFGLLGPNGAGKTTTIEILEGLLQPTEGTVEVLGRTWGKDNDELRQRIGISLQETRLADKITALETLQLFRSFYREGVEPDKVLDAVGLKDKSGAWVVTLSGGQRQRLAVASALVGNPELLFLDEPTTGLDPQARRDVWSIVRAQRVRGCTTLITTHYMDEAERLCDRVAVIDQGKLIALGAPQELIATLGGDHVIEFAPENGARDPAWEEGTFANLEGVRSVRRTESGFALTVREPHIALPALLRRIEGHKCELAHLTTRHASLEDVFVNLTGRRLCDEEELPTPA